MTRPEEVVLRGRRSHAVLVAGMLIAMVVGGAAATHNGTPPAETLFHVESSPRVFAGAAGARRLRYHRGPLRPRNVCLEVETLDADGTVIEEALGSVLGGLEPSSRADLIVGLKRTGSYRMRVLSFDPDGHNGSRS
jgi:hypothetical protein